MAMAMRWRWAAAVLAVQLGARARGDTITYTEAVTVPPGQTAASGVLPLFDPALGAFRSALVTDAITGEGAVLTATNTTGGDLTGIVSWDWRYVLTVGSLPFDLGAANFAAVAVVPAHATVTVPAVQGETSGGPTGEVGVSNFVGPGTFPIQFTSAYATFITLDPPGLTLAPSTLPTTATVSVTYTYTAVPEPPAVLSTGLLSGLGALGWWRRRRAA